MNKVQSILDRLKIHKVGGIKGEEQHCLCPFHDDASTSFSINVNTGLWKCFAGCGEGNLVLLLSKVYRIPFQVSIEILESEYGIKENLVSVPKNLPSFDELIQKEEDTFPLSKLHALEKELPEEAEEYLYQRIGNWQAYREHIFYDPSFDLIVFPLITKGKLFGLVGRSYKDSNSRYYLYDGSKVKESIFFYDYWNGDLPCLVTEGIFDTLNAIRLVGEKCEPIALSGSFISKKKAQLIAEKWDRIILGFDNDSTGRASKNKYGDMFRKLGKQVYYIKLGFYKDIGEISPENKDVITLHHYRITC